VPKFIHLTKVFPLPKKKLIGMQKACSKFIWRNRLERIALEQSHPKLTEGGLGLVILEQKCRALFSATLIKQFLGESSGTSFLNYWIGKALKGVKPNFVGLHARETHALFSNAVNDILYVHETYPNTQWSSMNTKAFYCILINKPNAKVSLYYLSSPILSPPTREHLFFTLHNLLLTRVRKKNLKIAMGDNCTHRKQAPEDIQHIFHCPASQPAVNWIRRKIDRISPELAKENNFSIFTLNFSIFDPNRKFSVIWLEANFITAIWHSRIEPGDNIIARVLGDMKPNIENLKKTQLYSNCFYPF